MKMPPDAGERLRLSGSRRARRGAPTSSRCSLGGAAFCRGPAVARRHFPPPRVMRPAKAHPPAGFRPSVANLSNRFSASPAEIPRLNYKWFLGSAVPLTVGDPLAGAVQVVAHGQVRGIGIAAPDCLGNGLVFLH